MKLHLFFTKFKIPLFLFLVCVVAYLPLSSFLFSLKNDALVYNLPPKNFFSEALRNGHFPIWNPYLNFGYPIYADPGFAWWNPITWLFGIIGYNAYTLNIELLFYIYIAGLGMYWLGRKLQFQKYTALAGGCIFMCCGFFVGNLQHINFLTCAAFLPWVTGYWILYQRKSQTKYLFGFSIFVYLLCTGGHPAIPLASAFFFLVVTIFYFLFNNNQENLSSFIYRQAKLLLCVFIFLLPLLISYLSILPFYVRSEPVDQSLNLDTGFSFQSYLSFLFPFATIKNYSWFQTDVSMRNAYFSIPGFTFFLLFLFQKQKTKFQHVFLFAGIIMLVMSAGGLLKELLYQNLPGFSFIKTNGEFRVFSIFSFLICSLYGIEKYFENDVFIKNQFKKIIITLIIITVISCIWILIVHHNNLFVTFNINESFTINKAKFYIDNISFAESVLISLLLFAILSSLYAVTVQKGLQAKIFLSILTLDVIINVWMLLPITGVGQSSTKDVQSVLNKAPKGFPSPWMIESLDKKMLTVKEQILIGDWFWYNKRIEMHEINYPSKLTATELFFKSPDTMAIKGKPFAFFKGQNGNTLHQIRFRPSASTFQINIQKKDTVVILQNNLYGWRAKLNHRPSPTQKYLSTFIAIPVDKGDSVLNIEFSPLIK